MDTRRNPNSSVFQQFRINEVLNMGSIIFSAKGKAALAPKLHFSLCYHRKYGETLLFLWILWILRDRRKQKGTSVVLLKDVQEHFASHGLKHVRNEKKIVSQLLAEVLK